MFNKVPKSVILASLLGLIPMLMGVASTFNIGVSESFKEDLIRIAIIYSGFILLFYTQLLNVGWWDLQSEISRVAKKRTEVLVPSLES